MEQIIMIEIFVEKIILKVVPPEKDEYEKQLEKEERQREAALALLNVGKKAKEPAKKKGKLPPPPTEDELRFLATCTVQMSCLPLFDFYIAHDNFIPPPPPKPPGKKAKPAKAKKGKPPPLILPSEPLPEPPYFGVGNATIFVSRPSKLEEELKKTPIYVMVWNRDVNMECIGFCTIRWHKSFFNCLQKASELNPIDMQQGQFRNTKKQEIVTNTVLLTESLQCEENLKASGEIKVYIRLSCLGNRIVSYLVTLPEMGNIRGRKYLTDGSKVKEVEVVRHWEGTLIEPVPPVAHFFLAPDITKDTIPMPEPKKVVFEKFVIPYTRSELEILAMGYPKGICEGGMACPRKMENRVVPQSLYRKPKRNIQCKKSKEVILRGVCGRRDCPNKVSPFVCDKGTDKSCRKACWYEVLE